MSNLDKAAQVVYESCYGRNLHPEQVGSIVRGLNDAGLLAPGLPKPEVRHIEEVDVNILAWKSDHIEVGVYKSRISIDDPPGPSMSPAEARELAHALLAACEYAEKEQDNE